MNKDYHNKFAPDIWCIFGGFHFSQNQLQGTKISRPELCTHVTFIDRILLIIRCPDRLDFHRGRREFGIDCRTDSCNSGKG